MKCVNCDNETKGNRQLCNACKQRSYRQRKQVTPNSVRVTDNVTQVTSNTQVTQQTDTIAEAINELRSCGTCSHLSYDNIRGLHCPRGKGTSVVWIFTERFNLNEDCELWESR